MKKVQKIKVIDSRKLVSIDEDKRILNIIINELKLGSGLIEMSSYMKVRNKLAIDDKSAPVIAIVVTLMINKILEESDDYIVLATKLYNQIKNSLEVKTV